MREEMEAAAVAKTTAGALSKVLAELKDLGVSFDTTDKLERSLEAKGVSRVNLTPCFSEHFSKCGTWGARSLKYKLKDSA